MDQTTNTSCKNGKTVAVIGSDLLNGCCSTIKQSRTYSDCFERDNAGGLLRSGIPNFKLEKGIIDRRVLVLEAEGIVFSKLM
jgi:glutamate synthase (NADPH/NADH) small chain